MCLHVVDAKYAVVPLHQHSRHRNVPVIKMTESNQLIYSDTSVFTLFLLRRPLSLGHLGFFLTLIAPPSALKVVHYRSERGWRNHVNNYRQTCKFFAFLVILQSVFSNLKNRF